ncbi:hypothetical protein HYFRA_00009525 [Hymenoscyphus fraxineus]|uniref:Nicotinamide-nucleotide adenylyltransferase n=1 Tax=Hymenoscyphus fraxineus TaxID=746836 RepID=A0A9N9KX77_9HELO|nr:hypothetical protein HYFRA_00009525 [Hymenoscyphus fraxineus]
MAARISTYSALLDFFTSSKHTFQILHSISSRASSMPKLLAAPPGSPPKPLHILDSSFNPPTLAHHRIILTSLLSAQQNFAKPDLPSPQQTPRLLLLLATQNADKAAKPASFPERLAMMELFASSILSSLSPPLSNELVIDIGVTKHPYFVDKSASIAQEAIYEREGQSEQIHLIGYDTLTRLLSPKYYLGTTLASLVPFLGKHRLEVTYRTDDKWGDRGAQDGFVRGIGEGRLCVRDGMAVEGGSEVGSLEEYGGVKAWVTEGRIVMVEGRKEGEEVVSSTKVREAVKKGDEEALRQLVDKGVGKFISERGLYLDE